MSMSMLLVDRGNTRLKWQLTHLDKVIAAGNQLKNIPFSTVFDDLEAKTVSAVCVASVADELFAIELKNWLVDNDFPKPVFVTSERSACGVINGYDDPPQLGVDRWLAVIAAYNKFDGMLCVVDAGTALTMDFVLENGRHLGGYIVPGSDMQIKALLSNTKNVFVGDETDNTTLATNTTQAVVAGVRNMLASFVKQTIKEMEHKFSTPITLIMTGGGAEELAAIIRIHGILEKNLVLEGLALVANQSR